MVLRLRGTGKSLIWLFVIYIQQCCEAWSLNVAPFPVNNPYAYLNDSTNQH